MVAREGRKTIFFAQHGFAHFLKYLEGTYLSSQFWRRNLEVLTQHQKTLGYLPFSEILSYLPSDFRDEAFSLGLGQSLDISVESVSAEAYEADYVRSISEIPPFHSMFDPQYASNADLVTRGNSLPPLLRYSLVTRLFSVSNFLASKVHRLCRPFLVQPLPYIGVHLRTTDRSTDSNRVRRKVLESLREAPSSRVFLASDDQTVSRDFIASFPGVEFVELIRPFSAGPGAKNLHFGVDDENALNQLVFALSDLYLLSKATRFIPAHKSRSQWTHLVRAIRAPWGQRFFWRVDQLARRDSCT